MTTRDLAEAAGVSEGTIFNVFDDKVELLDAVVATVTDPVPVNQAMAAIDPALSFTDQLIAATEALQQRTTNIWRLLSKLFEHQTPHHRRMSEHPALIEIMERHADRLSLPPTDAARTLQALVFALTHPMIAVEPTPAATIVDRFLHGCASERKLR